MLVNILVLQWTGEKPLTPHSITNPQWVNWWYLIHFQINGSVQDCSNSTALAMELLQSCTKPSTCDDDMLHSQRVNSVLVLRLATLNVNCQPHYWLLPVLCVSELTWFVSTSCKRAMLSTTSTMPSTPQRRNSVLPDSSTLKVRNKRVFPVKREFLCLADDLISSHYN